MFARRLGVLAASALGIVLMFGTVQAGATGSPSVLKFIDTNSQFTGIDSTPTRVQLRRWGLAS